MRDLIISIVFVFTSIVASFMCYRFQAWEIYEICFIVLGFIFTIILRNQPKKQKIIFICIVLFVKPLLVLSDDLYDPMTMLMGIPVDIFLTGIGLFIGFIFAKLFLYILNKVKK